MTIHDRLSHLARFRFIDPTGMTAEQICDQLYDNKVDIWHKGPSGHWSKYGATVHGPWIDEDGVPHTEVTIKHYDIERFIEAGNKPKMSRALWVPYCFLPCVRLSVLDCDDFRNGST